MAYPVRQFEPGTVYFVTSRTLQSRFLLAPGEKTNELIGGSLGRAVRLCGVELFAYVFMSNHFHLMVRAPSALAMSQFMQRLQSDIAVKVGRLVDWRGRFFARRYSAEPIVDEPAQVERLRYILGHGVKEGLVSAVLKWPGLSCARSLLGGTLATRQKWRNWTRRWRLKIKEDVKVGRFSKQCPSESETLQLSPLPCWAGLSDTERQRRAAGLVADIEATAQAAGGGVLGRRRIAAQDPHARPRHTSHAPRPKAHASTKEGWLSAVHRYKEFLAVFRRAARRWLAGAFDAVFPPNCFRPPAWGVP